MKKSVTKVVKAAVAFALAIGTGVGAVFSRQEANPINATVTVDSGFTAAAMAAGTNGSACTVDGDDGIKVGTSSKGGTMTVTVPAGATNLRVYSAAWNGVNGLSLNISSSPSITVSPSSIALEADSGIANSSPFTLSGSKNSFQFNISLSGVNASTVLTFTSSAAKRFVLWDAQYNSAGAVSKTTTVTTVTASENKDTLDVTAEPADTVQLNASVAYNNGASTILNPGIVWSGDNDEVATISQLGLVTAVAKGSARFTATYSGDSNYYGSSGYIDITVVNPNEVIFIAGTDVGESSGQNEDTIVKSDITLHSTSIYDTANPYRFYAGSITTISRESGKIASIVFEQSDGSYPVSRLSLTNESTGSYSNGIWTGAAQSVSFNASAQARASTITITYYTGADVDLDKTSLNLTVGGSSSTVKVSSISGVTNPSYSWSRKSGADCITLDDDDTDTVTVSPKGSKFAYCVLSLTINGDNLQEAITRDVNICVSRESSSGSPYDVSEAMNAIDSLNESFLNSAHVVGKISQIDEFANGAITYWISDDGTTTNQFEVYKGLGLSGASFTSINDIEIGATATVHGQIKKYNQTYEFAKDNELSAYIPLPAANSVRIKDTSSNLTYHYNKTGADDILDRAFTGVAKNSTYTDWSDKTATSGAVYSGNSGGNNDSIQLTANNSNSGIISTVSGGKITKVTVVWESQTANGRTLSVYGKNTAYSAVTELFDAEEKGTLLGTIIYGTSTELTIAGDYAYIGLACNTGAMFLKSIDIQWDGGATYNYSNVAVKFGGKISTELWTRLNTESHGILGYGVMLSTSPSIASAYASVRAAQGSVANSFTEVAEKQYDFVKGTQIKCFYKEVSTMPRLIDGNYVWDLVKGVNTTDVGLKKGLTAVAFIRTTDDEIIFLQETTKSAAQVAKDIINADPNDEYDDDYLEGSLAYLASKAN